MIRNAWQSQDVKSRSVNTPYENFGMENFRKVYWKVLKLAEDYEKIKWLTFKQILYFSESWFFGNFEDIGRAVSKGITL